MSEDFTILSKVLMKLTEDFGFLTEDSRKLTETIFQMTKRLKILTEHPPLIVQTTLQNSMKMSEHI